MVGEDSREGDGHGTHWKESLNALANNTTEKEAHKRCENERRVSPEPYSSGLPELGSFISSLHSIYSEYAPVVNSLLDVKYEVEQSCGDAEAEEMEDLVVEWERARGVCETEEREREQHQCREPNKPLPKK